MSSDAPEGTSITIKKNGPLLVRGDITVLDFEGNVVVPPKNPFALCRCGHSENKPFCDGAHNRQGFCDTAADVLAES